MKLKSLAYLLIGLLASASYVSNASVTSESPASKQNVFLQSQPGFFHFSFEEVKMPKCIANMGLLGVNYYADITPTIYSGVGGYGSVTGTS